MADGIYIILHISPEVEAMVAFYTAHMLQYVNGTLCGQVVVS